MSPGVERAIEAIRALPWRGIEFVRPPAAPEPPRPGRRGPTAAARPMGETSTRLLKLLRANPGWHRTRHLADGVGEPSRRICSAMKPLVERGLVARRPAGKEGGRGREGVVYRALGVALFLASAACCGGAEAQQQMPCAKLAELTAGLAERYREKPVAAGLQANGQLLEIFASPDGSTWTALTTSPAGLACVVATGRGWQQGVVGEPS